MVKNFNSVKTTTIPCNFEGHDDKPEEKIEGENQSKEADSEIEVYFDALVEFHNEESPSKIEDPNFGKNAQSESSEHHNPEAEISWVQIVEENLNQPWLLPMHENGEILSGFPECRVLEAILYRLANSQSLVVLRCHTSACDRTSAAIVTRQFLEALRLQMQPNSSQSTAVDEGALPFDFLSVEDVKPKHKYKKPFWAHGTDIVGYSLASRRHALLPFQAPGKERQSGLIRRRLNRNDTNNLLTECRNRSVNLSAALMASILKAAAAVKGLGSHKEKFSMTVLIDCRPFFDPPIVEPLVGFYHSALQKAFSVDENFDFWTLAGICFRSTDEAISHGKHFSDMGDLNLLMKKAIDHPNLTPSSSMRTSLLSIFWDTYQDSMREQMEEMNIVDFVGCSSVHGVGPCIGIFDSVRDGELDLTIIFVEPLLKRQLVEDIMDISVQFLSDTKEKALSVS